MRNLWLFFYLASCVAARPVPCLLNRPLPTVIKYAEPSRESLETVCGELGTKVEHAVKISFYNVLTTYVTDQKPEIRTKYPAFHWENRKNALIELIARDQPDVLGLCELDLRQVRTFQQASQEGERLSGYTLVGFSSELKGSIEEVKEKYKEDEQAKYGNFVALLVCTNRVAIDRLKCHLLPSVEGQRWNRILVEAHLRHKNSGIPFACLVSHFDHEQKAAREAAARFEVDLIAKLCKQRLAWFSVGDRNWYREDDEQSPEPYLQWGRDFRDETHLGVFGPPGTFAGLPWLSRPMPYVTLEDGSKWIDAWVVDVGFSDKERCIPLYYYTKAGEFNPQTGVLLDHPFAPENRNFVSDHYLMGAVFILNASH